MCLVLCHAVMDHYEYGFQQGTGGHAERPDLSACMFIELAVPMLASLQPVLAS